MVTTKTTSTTRKPRKTKMKTPTPEVTPPQPIIPEATGKAKTWRHLVRRDLLESINSLFRDREHKKLGLTPFEYFYNHCGWTFQEALDEIHKQEKEFAKSPRNITIPQAQLLTTNYLKDLENAANIEQVIKNKQKRNQH